MEIESRLGRYTVDSFDSLEAAMPGAVSPGRTWGLVDDFVAESARTTLLAHIPAERILALPSREDTKSFENLGGLLQTLLGGGFRRDCRILAIGGGVVQDTAGFIANILMRGVSWVFVPSTLLAQADSCIGAKTSINVGPYKNQVGTFYPPERVLLVSSLLDSLPPDQRRSGLGEVAKFHLLEGEETWRWIQRRLTWEDTSHLAELVHRSLLIKKRYIEADEFDRGIRNLLNYGHTFGHAFESATGFAIPHGMAVALGVCAATHVSEELGLAPRGHTEEVTAVLRPLFSPYEQHLAAADRESLRASMKVDKKNVAGATYCILTRGPGRMEKVAVNLDVVVPMLDAFVNRITSRIG